MSDTTWRERLHSCSEADRPALLAGFARDIRTHAVTTIAGAGLGHIGGDYSITDALATLYGAVLRIDPLNPAMPSRDRFIMSKGHAAASLYSAMALTGYFPIEELATFAQADTRLGGHPNRRKLPGIETNTGPLGHGLPVAVGIAVGAEITDSDARVYVAVGDGEMQEGSNWEAIMFAGHRQLSNLTLIVDKNDLQQGARVSGTNSLDPLDAKFAAFNWDVSVIDGHDYISLYDALSSRHHRPHVVIARTTKGKGVSFMEDRAEWHHKVPSAEQVEAAIKELTA
jgi:transketolase